MKPASLSAFLQIIWVMRHSHIGDAFFDRDAAEYLLGQLRGPEAASRSILPTEGRYTLTYLQRHSTQQHCQGQQHLDALKRCKQRKLVQKPIPQTLVVSPCHCSVTYLLQIALVVVVQHVCSSLCCDYAVHESPPPPLHPPPWATIFVLPVPSCISHPMAHHRSDQ